MPNESRTEVEMTDAFRSKVKKCADREGMTFDLFVQRALSREIFGKKLRPNVNRPFPAQPAIKAAMKLRGLSARDVAKRAGLSHGYVTLLLNGFSFSESALVAIGKIAVEKPKL